MIKRIARTAGFSGLLAALLLTLLQSFWVAPLILEAETYESASPAAAHHSHDEKLALATPMAKTPGRQKMAGSAPSRPQAVIWWLPSASP